MADCDVLEADVMAEEVADECTSSDQFSDDSVQIISETPGPTSLTSVFTPTKRPPSPR